MPEVVIVGGGLEGCPAAWALAERGVTDVVVVERDTVGSGGTGKSSGVVRCHYGVSSLAAMATRALAFFEEHAEEVGFHQTGYVVGVGPENVAALAASLADQRAVGVRTDEVTADEVQRLWPVADLSPFAAFAWEERGGYGDAYRTAQYFAATARAAGVRLRQGTTVTSLLVDGGRTTGVRLADGTTVEADAVVVAAGPWSVGLLAAHGVDLPITVHREQIVLVDPGRDLGEVPVFSDLVSLQYVRPGSGGEILFGNSDLAELEPADPDRYSDQATEAFLEMAVDKVGTRFPGLANATIASSYAGCYDVTPDFNPAISRTALEGLVVAAGFSGHGFKNLPVRRPAGRRSRGGRVQLRAGGPGVRLPAGPLRRGRPAAQPPPLRRRGGAAVAAATRPARAAARRPDPPRRSGSPSPTTSSRSAPRSARSTP